MLGKALTTVLLAATLAIPQAQAGSAFSTTIVIRSVPTIQIAHQGGYQRHWHKRPAHHSRFAGHHKRHHFGHHPRRHAAAARRHWGGRHQPRQHAATRRHGNFGRHSRH